MLPIINFETAVHMDSIGDKFVISPCDLLNTSWNIQDNFDSFIMQSTTQTGRMRSNKYIPLRTCGDRTFMDSNILQGSPNTDDTVIIQQKFFHSKKKVRKSRKITLYKNKNNG